MAVCTKHRCRLIASSVPAKSEQSYVFYPAESYVQDSVAVVENNESLIRYTEYLAAVFDAPVDLNTDTTTRAMAWTMLARLDGTDTSGGANWYEKGLDWAKENGISDGTNATGEITREQLAVMLWRLVGSPDAYDSSLAALGTYTDGDSISSYAQDAMAWAISNGIISGMGNGILNPGGNATRAQVAQIIMNFMMNI